MTLTGASSGKPLSMTVHVAPKFVDFHRWCTTKVSTEATKIVFGSDTSKWIQLRANGSPGSAEAVVQLAPPSIDSSTWPSVVTTPRMLMFDAATPRLRIESDVGIVPAVVHSDA